MNQKQMQTQLTLLKEYIKTLQHQNQAKNTQRQTLYSQLSQLESELTTQSSQIQTLHEQAHNREFYIQQMQQNFELMRTDLQSYHKTLQNKETQMQQMQQNFELMRADLQSLNRTLQDKESQMQNFKYQQEKDAERIMWLEEMLREGKVKQGRLKDELGVAKAELGAVMQELQALREQSKRFCQRIEDSSQVWSGQERINQLIQNYQKIQVIAKQKSHENEVLRRQNELLVDELYTYKNALNLKQKQLNNLERAQRRKQPSQSHRQSFRQPTPKHPTHPSYPSHPTHPSHPTPLTHQLLSNINLIRQNNTLIERITELQKQKNTIYAEVYESMWRGDSAVDMQAISPLRILGCVGNFGGVGGVGREGLGREGRDGGKLRDRINQLKVENQVLLENLRI